MFNVLNIMVTNIALTVVKVSFSSIYCQVPHPWYDLWEGPEDPIHYLRSLVAKSLALGSWEEKGQAGVLLQGEVLDLSELFHPDTCLLYTSPSPRDATLSRMPSSA